MRVFLTGATGFIGSSIVPELLKAGHRVLGLTRSEAGAQSLIAAGAEVHRGTLEDPKSLRSGAAQSDGVIHCAFDHDFSNFVANCDKDRRAIEALGAALAGSDRPLVITSGTGMGNTVPGQPASEENPPDPDHPHPRAASERAAAVVLRGGVNVSVVRLPQVHNTVKQGFVTHTVALARAKGMSAYVGDGLNRIGRGLKVPAVALSPEEAADHFGWLAAFVSADLPASSALTQKRLGWHPTGPGMIADLEQMRYSGA